MKENFYNIVEKFLNEKYPTDLKESTSKFTNIKVTYNDGSFYTTQISSDLESFKKYLRVGSVVVTHEDDETGKETKKKIVKIEQINESVENEDWEVLNKLKLKDHKREWFKIMLDDGAIEEKDVAELFQMIKDDKKLGTIAKKYPKTSHGLETVELENKKGTSIKFSYLNSGDIDGLTLVRNPISGKIEFTTYSDMVEYLEKKGYQTK